MPQPEQNPNRSAYRLAPDGSFRSTELTRGPWDPGHQHAGPPIALVSRSLAAMAEALGLRHVARLTANLVRPIPIAPLTVETAIDHTGRNVVHLSARLLADAREVARFTAVAQRDVEIAIHEPLEGHPLPLAPQAPESSPPTPFPHRVGVVGYHDLVEFRSARGTMFRGPSAVWFRLAFPIVEDSPPGPLERVAVAADSGNGISAVLDFRRYTFVNTDLTINLLRPAQGEWVCVEARTLVGPAGSGIAESNLYDAGGLIGRAAQTLLIRQR